MGLLMTRDVLPESKHKSYSDQCKLVEDHAARAGLNYVLPGALEASVVMLLHHVRSGDDSDTDTYIRCRDKDTNGCPVIVKFEEPSLQVSSNNSVSCYDFGRGVAVLRKL